MCASSLGNESMSTRLVHGGSTSLPPAVIMFVTLPSIYVVYKIGLYKQNVCREYFRESQSVREIHEIFSPENFSLYGTFQSCANDKCKKSSETHLNTLLLHH